MQIKINSCRRQQRNYVMERMSDILNEHVLYFPEYFSSGVPDDFNFVFSRKYSWNTVVATLNRQIVGFAVYSFESAYNYEYFEKGDYPVVILRAIFVEEKSRRQCIARKLIKYIADEGIKNDCDDFESLTWECCADYSVEFYQKCGLRVKKYLIERDASNMENIGSGSGIKFLSTDSSKKPSRYAKKASELLFESVQQRMAFASDYLLPDMVLEGLTEFDDVSLQTAVAIRNRKIEAVLQYCCRETDHNCSVMQNFKTAKLLVFGGDKGADEATVGGFIDALLQREGRNNIDMLQFDVWIGDEAVAAALENKFGFKRINYKLAGKCREIAERNSEKVLKERAEADELFAGFWDGVDGEYIYFENKAEMVEKVERDRVEYEKKWSKAGKE